MGKGIFVTGTGTDVGKTYVTGLIIKKIKENGMTPGYFKAAMSGMSMSMLILRIWLHVWKEIMLRWQLFWIIIEK